MVLYNKLYEKTNLLMNNFNFFVNNKNIIWMEVLFMSDKNNKENQNNNNNKNNQNNKNNEKQNNNNNR